MNNWKSLVETLLALYRQDSYSLTLCNNLCHQVEAKGLTDQITKRVEDLQEKYSLRDSLILACKEYNIVS